jgi:hypothetical protein
MRNANTAHTCSPFSVCTWENELNNSSAPEKEWLELLRSFFGSSIIVYYDSISCAPCPALHRPILCNVMRLKWAISKYEHLQLLRLMVTSA